MAGVESEISPLRVGIAPPHRPFSAAATSDKRDPAIRGVACVGGWYAVVDAGNDCATVIGDALSASASYSRWLAKPIIKAETIHVCLLLSKRNQTNESECYAG